MSPFVKFRFAVLVLSLIIRQRGPFTMHNSKASRPPERPGDGLVGLFSVIGFYCSHTGIVVMASPPIRTKGVTIQVLLSVGLQKPASAMSSAAMMALSCSARFATGPCNGVRGTAAMNCVIMTFGSDPTSTTGLSLLQAPGPRAGAEAARRRG